MIKPEDLRIGDIVKVSCDCEFPKGTVGTVFGINTIDLVKSRKGIITLIPLDGNDDNWQGVWCDEIEGIPLTPEILEKNEWYPSSGTDPYCYVQEYNLLEVELPPHSEWKYAVVGSETLHRIKYVHELQHILWALGYNAQMTYPEDLDKQK